MKVFFGERTCPECEDRHDVTYPECPRCGREELTFEEKERFLHDVHVPVLFNVLFLLVCLVGIDIVSLVPSTIFSYLIESNQTLYLTLVNAVTYFLLTGIMVILLVTSKSTIPYLREFKKGKTYLFGLLGFLALYGASITWSLISSLIDPGVSDNANQSAIVNITASYPLISILAFGICGPLCEELAYRLGLFTLLKRIALPLAYIGTMLIFGFIHFDFSCLASGDGAKIANEFLNLPSYMIAGFIFSFIYQHWGIGASSIAHILNNMLSLLFIIGGLS